MAYAWLFPGQGAQSVGMGRALTEVSARAREAYARADAALGFSISTLCFDGPEEKLTLTEYTQPAILTTSIAALWALQERFPKLPTPSYVLGHSLGEYSALVAAGSLDLEDAVRVVHLRGKAMQEAVPAGTGAMAAILGASIDAVLELCREASLDETLSPANFNGPGQIVIAGTAGAIARATDLAKTRSMKAIALKVSAPFHCALMAPAAERVGAALDAIEVRPAEIPLIANVTAAPHTAADLTRKLLVEQVASAVRWEQSVGTLVAQGVHRALEIGPGKVLAGLCKRIDKTLEVKTFGQPDDFAAIAEVVEALGTES